MSPKGQSWKPKRMQTHKRTYFNPFGGVSETTLKTPIVRIENHDSEVLSCAFHPSGKYLVSSNRQGHIQVCDIYGTFSKIMVMKGHTGPVMNTEFSRDGFNVYSCSTDKTLGIWDTFKGCRSAKLEGHTGEVNSVEGTRMGYPLLCSGSSDDTIRIWDSREQKSTLTLDSGAKVNATCFSELGEYVFSGGVDNDITIWDLRRKEILYKLCGHTDVVTGISLSPCGRYLLSHSVDNTLRIWDVRPYVTFERNIRCFSSNQRGVMDNLLKCSWSEDGTMISAGTVESDVFIWDSDSGLILLELPGHESCVNEVVFHPKESIVLSASNDKYLFLNEI